MKIAKIEVYQVDLPLVMNYGLSGGRSYNRLDSTIVAVTTDSGIVGWGESCPWGADYLPGHPKGVRAGLDELAPHLLGLEATSINVINHVMDRELIEHLYVKTCIDMACWDILGKATNLPLFELFGGAYPNPVPTISSVHYGTIDEITAHIQEIRETRGSHFFSCKVGATDMNLDKRNLEAVMKQARDGEFYIFDVNKGFCLADALRFAAALEKYDVAYEQPVATYEEFLALRRRTRLPLVIDEIFSDVNTLIRIIQDHTCEIINIKIGKVGGLSKALLIRGICAAQGLSISAQSVGGSQITFAAVSHFAQSTPPKILHSMWDCTEVIDTVTATGVPEVKGGVARETSNPGLGVKPDMSVLGKPIAVYEKR